jgi:hypothetical protein
VFADEINWQRARTRIAKNNIITHGLHGIVQELRYFVTWARHWTGACHYQAFLTITRWTDVDVPSQLHIRIAMAVV